MNIMATKKKTEEAVLPPYHYAVGRRKSATARSKYYPGDLPLIVNVNKKPIAEYFPDFFAKTVMNAIANIGITTGRFDIFVNSGGNTGQAEAARLAVGKSVLKADETMRPILRLHGYLSTDIRKVLPKRSGLRKNRKREQWSKR